MNQRDTRLKKAPRGLAPLEPVCQISKFSTDSTPAHAETPCEEGPLQVDARHTWEKGSAFRGSLSQGVQVKQ